VALVSGILGVEKLFGSSWNTLFDAILPRFCPSWSRPPGRDAVSASKTRWHCGCGDAAFVDHR
jgi:hypothetical protein